MVGKTFQILLSEFEKMKNEDDYIAEAIDYDVNILFNSLENNNQHFIVIKY